jgi:hypothetical protein
MDTDKTRQAYDEQRSNSSTNITNNLTAVNVLPKDQLARSRVVQVLELMELGTLTQTEIAIKLGITQGHVSTIYDRYSDARILARSRMRNQLPKLVETLANTADTKVALSTLRSYEVVPPEATPTNTNNIVIAVGSPFSQTELKLPSINLDTVSTKIKTKSDQ